MADAQLIAEQRWTGLSHGHAGTSWLGEERPCE